MPVAPSTALSLAALLAALVGPVVAYACAKKWTRRNIAELVTGAPGLVDRINRHTWALSDGAIAVVGPPESQQAHDAHQALEDTGLFKKGAIAHIPPQDLAGAARADLIILTEDALSAQTDGPGRARLLDDVLSRKRGIHAGLIGYAPHRRPHGQRVPSDRLRTHHVSDPDPRTPRQRRDLHAHHPVPPVATAPAGHTHRPRPPGPLRRDRRRLADGEHLGRPVLGRRPLRPPGGRRARASRFVARACALVSEEHSTAPDPHGRVDILAARTPWRPVGGDPCETWANPGSMSGVRPGPRGAFGPVAIRGPFPQAGQRTTRRGVGKHPAPSGALRQPNFQLLRRSSIQSGSTQHHQAH